MKLWQQVSVLGLGCMLTANSFAGVVVDRAESGSVKVFVDDNETNTVQSEKASKLSLSSTRSKVGSNEQIEVEVDGVKNTTSSGARSKKDKVSLNARGNNPVQVAVGSSDTATTETSTVDVNSEGGAKVDVALDSDVSSTSQVNYVEVNSIGGDYDDDHTYVEVDNRRSGGEDYDSFGDFAEGLIPVIAIRAGLADASIGETQDLESVGSKADRLKYNEDSDTQFVGGAFAGVELPLTENGRCRWQTGLAYYQTAPFKVDGVDYKRGDESKVARTFEYEVHNLRLMWENKFLVGFNDRFSGYLLGAIGWSRNQASDFHSTVVDHQVVSNIGFEDGTRNNFSYSFGIGLEMALAEQLRLGLGYQFTELGKVKFGNSTEPEITNTIENSNTPTNEVILGLSYIFN
jgi:opacity protein-like surface antigen